MSNKIPVLTAYAGEYGYG